MTPEIAQANIDAKLAREDLARLTERVRELEADAERYRWLRSEDVSTNPAYYAFWDEFCAKLCREERMDKAIDAARLGAAKREAG